jgi:DNA-binding helix-hairpin-helix protein with protein kinase domain
VRKNQTISLQDNVRESQLQKFLDGQYIDNHSISGIGPSRKATLSSFGVETAADVTWNQIINIPGFGSTFTRELVDWRKSLERRFVFDPSKGVNPADIAALNQRFSHRRKQIEVSLLAGPEQLINIRDSVLEYRKFFPVVQQAAQQLAQAEADLSLLK